MTFRTQKLLPTALTAAALIAFPALAQADHRHRDRHDHGRHSYAPPVYRHGAFCASRHGRPAAYGHAAHYDRPYHCRPCSRHFRSWRSFRQHVHQRHHVAPWLLPRLLVRSGSFWLYLG